MNRPEELSIFYRLRDIILHPGARIIVRFCLFMALLAIPAFARQANAAGSETGQIEEVSLSGSDRGQGVTFSIIADDNTYPTDHNKISYAFINFSGSGLNLVCSAPNKYFYFVKVEGGETATINIDISLLNCQIGGEHHVLAVECRNNDTFSYRTEGNTTVDYGNAVQHYHTITDNYQANCTINVDGKIFESQSAHVFSSRA